MSTSPALAPVSLPAARNPATAAGRTDGEELDEVVEIAVSLPEFGRTDREPSEAVRPRSGAQRWLLRATAVVGCLVVATAAGVLGGARPTVAGPTVTVTVPVSVATPAAFDAVHGLIQPGRWTIGRDVQPGRYRAVPDAHSEVCEWTLRSGRGSGFWRVNRTQWTTTTTLAELTVRGQEIESRGCHWRWSG